MQNEVVILRYIGHDFGQTAKLNLMISPEKKHGNK